MRTFLVALALALLLALPSPAAGHKITRPDCRIAAKHQVQKLKRWNRTHGRYVVRVRRCIVSARFHRNYIHAGLRCRRTSRMPAHVCAGIVAAARHTRRVPVRWAYDRNLHLLLSWESGWNIQARNSSSGACGLYQFLPCRWHGRRLPSARIQSLKGLVYIRDRYGTPAKAVHFWRCTGRCTSKYGVTYKTGHWY